MELPVLNLADHTTLPAMPAVLSQSALRTLHSCKRRFAFRHRFHMVPKGAGESAESPALRLGTLFHLFACELYKGATWEAAYAKAQGLTRDYATRLIGQVDASGVDRTGRTADQIAVMLERELRKAAVGIRLFNKLYPIDTNRFEVVDVEVPHRVDLEWLEAPIGTGGIDLRLREKSTGRIYIADHKFLDAKADLQQYVEGMEWDVQVWLSRIISEAVHTEPPFGFIFNCVKKPGIYICGKDQEWARRAYQAKWDDAYKAAYQLAREADMSAKDAKNAATNIANEAAATVPIQDVGDAHMERVEEWYGEQEAPPFMRAEFRYTGPAIDLEKRDQLEEAAFLATTEPWSHLFPKDYTRKACRDWQRKCPYHDLCSRDEVMWPEFIPGRYTTEDPMLRDIQTLGGKDTDD